MAELSGAIFFYLKDTKSFSDALSFSMSAGGGGWGASYGMTAAASALLQTSSLTQTIHFRAVGQKTQSMVRPDAVLTAAAAKILAEGTFLQRYGTHFVAGYVYGKSCNLSYHLNFSTLDLATKFSASFSESESELGFGENMQTSITNTLNTSQSKCRFSVESEYRGFVSPSPETMTDLAKVVTAYDAAADDSTAILLIICPWTYLDQISASFGLPINEALEDLASLTNSLIYIKQSSQNFLSNNLYAGGSQWKAITSAEKPVQKEMDDILTFLQKCNNEGTTVTEESISQFAPVEPLQDQMNTALARFCLAFSVAVAGAVARPIAPADELTPQSQAFQVSDNGRLLSTLYNNQSKGVWFDWSGVHTICSIPAYPVGDVIVGFTEDAVGGILECWCVSSGGDNPHTASPIKIQGSTNSLSLQDENNTAKMYWRQTEQVIDITVTLGPV